MSRSFTDFLNLNEIPTRPSPEPRRPDPMPINRPHTQPFLRYFLEPPQEFYSTRSKVYPRLLKRFMNNKVKVIEIPLKTFIDEYAWWLHKNQYLDSPYDHYYRPNWERIEHFLRELGFLEPDDPDTFKPKTKKKRLPYAINYPITKLEDTLRFSNILEIKELLK